MLTRLSAGMLLLFFIGCGSSLGTQGVVSGKVTYEGKPLPGGQVTFMTPQGYVFTGDIDTEGNYKLKALVGEARVGVDNRMLLPTNGPSLPSLRRPPGIEPPPGAKVDDANKSPANRITGTYVAFPDKYRSPDSSGLKCTVTSGSQTYDIELSDNPSRAPGS